jgi:hypothetical protein
MVCSQHRWILEKKHGDKSRYVIIRQEAKDILIISPASPGWSPDRVEILFEINTLLNMMKVGPALLEQPSKATVHCIFIYNSALLKLTRSG